MVGVTTCNKGLQGQKGKSHCSMWSTTLAGWDSHPCIVWLSSGLVCLTDKHVRQTHSTSLQDLILRRWLLPGSPTVSVHLGKASCHVKQLYGAGKSTWWTPRSANPRTVPGKESSSPSWAFQRANPQTAPDHSLSTGHYRTRTPTQSLSLRFFFFKNFFIYYF